jgi:putative sugar O-methyltransferase
MPKIQDYINRKYYRRDAIFESIKVLFFSFFIKKPKLYTNKTFLYKMPPTSVIRYNFLGRVLFNLYNIILFFFKDQKIKFLIEDNKLIENDPKKSYLKKDSLTNPVPILIKNSYPSSHSTSPRPSFPLSATPFSKGHEINLDQEYFDTIKKSYISALNDDHLNFKNSLWWNECIKEIQSKFFDQHNNPIIYNFKNFFDIKFKAALFENSSPLQKNNTKIKNFFSALNVINQYHYLSDIIDDYVLRSISESEVGNNKSVIYNGQRLSSRLIRHGYFASQIFKNTNFLNNKNFIFLDLGGGFGSLSRILLNFNINSKCIIIEQPEICAVANFYMKSNFPKKKILNYEDFKNSKSQNKLFESIEFDVLILPSFSIENIPDNFVNLSINTASLGEMSKEFGMYYIKNIERITKDYFYSVNKLNSNENIWDGYGHNQF